MTTGSTVFNPHKKDVDTLPVIYVFSNNGTDGEDVYIALAEDGTVLGSHYCSNYLYAPGDLGMDLTRRQDRRDTYARHYPDGYVMLWVPHDVVPSLNGIQQAIEKNRLKSLETVKETFDVKIKEITGNENS